MTRFQKWAVWYGAAFGVIIHPTEDGLIEARGFGRDYGKVWTAAGLQAICEAR